MPNRTLSDQSPRVLDPWWKDRCVLAVVVLATVLKALVVFAVEPLEPVGDAVQYVASARQLVEDGTYKELLWAPLYPGFLAGVYKLGGAERSIRLLQVLLSAITAVLIYRIARRAHGRRAARIACSIVAFDPVGASFTHVLWTETLFVFLVILGSDLLLVRGASRNVLRWFGAGLVFGIAALGRSQLLTFLPLVLIWGAMWMGGRGQHERDRSSDGGSGGADVDFRQRRRELAGVAAALVLGCAAVVTPWTIHNRLVTGAWVLVDSKGAWNLLKATSPEIAFVAKDDHYDWRWSQIDGAPYHQAARKDPARTQRLALELAWQRLWEHPGIFVRKSLWEAGHLWTLDSFPLRHLRNGWYGPEVPVWVLPVAVVVGALFTVWLYVCGFAGLVLQPRSASRTWIAFVLLHAMVLFGLTLSVSRFAVPLRPWLAVAAGWSIANLHSGLAPLATREGLRRQGLFLLLIFVGLCWVWWQDLPLLLDMLTNGGAEYRFRVYR